MPKSQFKLGLVAMALFLVGCTTTSPSESLSTPSVVPTSAESSVLVSSEVPSSSEVVSSEVSSSSEGISYPEEFPFVPGYKGSAPNVSGLETIPNQFPGLYVEQLDRQRLVFIEATTCEALLKFPEPWTIEANFFRLQSYNDETSSWSNYGEGDDYLSDYNNFIVPAQQGLKLRLLAIGGPKDGYVSNEVILAYSSIENKFMGYSLDEGMAITGVMSPYVGRGLEASFSLAHTMDDEPMLGALTYQWYRVNPYTYAHDAIAGATGLNYVTTMADLGYYIAIIATGDGVNAGGYFEIISGGEPVTLPVKAFASDITTTSFTLYFDYSLPAFNLASLSIMEDVTDATVEIASAVLNPDKVSATITLTTASGAPKLYLNYTNGYIALVEHQYAMPMIEIALT